MSQSWFAKPREARYKADSSWDAIETEHVQITENAHTSSQAMETRVEEKKKEKKISENSP